MKKARKFGRGGVLTGIGAALIAKGLYDKYVKGDDEPKANIKRNDESAPTPYDRGEAGRKAIRDAMEGNKEDKELSKRGKFPYEAGDGTSGGFDSRDDAPKPEPKPEPAPAPVVKNVSKKDNNKKDNNKKDNNKKDNNNKDNAAVVPNVKPGESRSVGDGEYKPYPSDAQRAKTKEAARVKDLRKRGFVTPGEDKNRKDTTRGRSANPIQGTIDNAGKSMARTREQQIQDNIRAVAKRKEEEQRRKKFEEEAASGRGIKKGGMVKKYASGGSVSASRRADGIAQRGKTRGKVY